MPLLPCRYHSLEKRLTDAVYEKEHQPPEASHSSNPLGDVLKEIARDMEITRGVISIIKAVLGIDEDYPVDEGYLVNEDYPVETCKAHLLTPVTASTVVGFKQPSNGLG